MIRPIARAFSSFVPGGSGKFNITKAYQRLKSAVRAPVKHLKRNLEPTAANYNPFTNTTEEAFDEVAQEWQALIMGNPYDTQTMNMLEQAMVSNFGTVDNPHVVFTADAPFRYVGCTGLANEDDYEGHEFLMFMLREGPLQRCPSCGQVFKLVRLRNEFSPEMDYYLSNIVPYYMDEMGEMDTVINMSVFRMQKDTYEYSQFETPSTNVYNLVNPDEHDRLLTDPAYRLERSKALEEKLYVYLYSLKTIENEYIQNFGPVPRYPINKVDYETLIEVEKAVMKLDRLFRRVDKFNHRKYIDRENHERRERRMEDRAHDRTQNNFTFYYGGLTEEEQKYRDYYETDLENEPEDEELEAKFDEGEIFAKDRYSLDKFDFQELYTRTPEDDQSSYLDKKAFKFKYRRAKDSAETYDRRQNRMVARQIERFHNQGVAQLVGELNSAIEAGNKAAISVKERQYLDILAKDAVIQYQDYFESDVEEDFTVFDTISDNEKVTFLRVFEDSTNPKFDNKGYETIPKRPWDQTAGLWANFYYSLQGLNAVAFPRARELANATHTAASEPLTKEELQQIGVYNVERVEGSQPEQIEGKKAKKGKSQESQA